MKLKKVTALLLATSMVLSSVSVASFADDELIFEPEVSVTTEAGEDEAYFGDDVVTGDEQNEEDSASDETFFADEVIEDDQVPDDVIAEDSAADQEAYAFEEDAFVGNEDVLEAIASEDEAYEETVISKDGIPKVEHVYDGKPATIDTSALEALGGVIVWYNDSGTWTSATAPDAAKFGTTAPQLIHVDQSTNNNYYWAAVKKDGVITNMYSFEVAITPATATATMIKKTDTWGGKWGKVAAADFEISGTINNESVTMLTLSPDDVNWDTIITADNKALRAENVGEYVIPDTSFADFTATPSSTDYKLELKGGSFEIKKHSDSLTVTWAGGTNFKFAYDGDEHSLSENVAPTSVKIGEDETVTAVTVKFENDKKTEAGKYTAAVKAVTLAGSGEDVSANFNIINPTQEWEITSTKVKVRVEANLANTVNAYYGETKESVLKKLSLENVTYKVLDPSGSWIAASDSSTPTLSEIKNTITGTPTFDTDYEQYKSVVWDSNTPVEGYSAWYVEGLNSDVYELEAYKPTTLTKKIKIVQAPVIVSANSIIVGIDAEPADLTDQYTVTDGKDESKTITGSADALERDIKDGRIKVTLTTTPDKPSAIGKYNINVKFENTNNTTDKAVSNFKFYKLVNGTQVTTDITPATITDAVKEVTVVDKEKYTVTWGDFKLTFDDYEGAYDGQEHGIVVEPKDIPASITVYYYKYDWQEGDAADAGDTAAAGKGWKNPVNGSVFIQKTNSSTTMPTRKDAGKSTVYYFVTSTDYQENDTALAEWGSKNIVIKSGAQAVEDQIDKATTKDASGNYDAEAIKAARAAYDALSADEKKQVSVSKLRKLEDAEEAIKDQEDAKAAKAVEDEIDKLPAVDKVTADDKAAADKAVEDYNKLTDDQKKLVPADKVKKMNDVKAAADAAAEGDAKKAAKAVEDEIAALPDPEKATAADKAAADKAKADYDALTEDQKKLVPDEAVDKMDAVKAAADEAAEKEEEAKKEVEDFDEKVAAVRETKNGVDGKAAAEKAKEKYDALSPEAKALLTEEEKTAYEETQNAYKKDKTFNSGEGVFKVLGNGELTYLKPLHPENTWFVVPNMVKKNGFLYKVVKVSTKAFMGCEKATKIKIGKNVQSMGEYVFKNTPAMGKLIMLTSKLATGKVKNTFVSGGKDKGAKLTNYVPSGKSSAYESLFKGEGGMNAGAKFTEAD